MHTTETSNKHMSGLQNGDIQCVCEQLKDDITKMLNETKNLDDHEKFKKLHRLNELKQILLTIEDIDHSVDQLLEKQVQKRFSDVH